MSSINKFDKINSLKHMEVSLEILNIIMKYELQHRHVDTINIKNIGHQYLT